MSNTDLGDGDADGTSGTDDSSGLDELPEPGDGGSDDDGGGDGPGGDDGLPGDPGDDGDDDGPGGGGDDSGDDDGTGPEAVCSAPVGLYDVSSPRVVVGDGTPASCTQASLKSAAEGGGTIVFDCGAEPVTIAMTETIVLPVDRNTIIDGGGLVTLDAQGQTRHFLFDHPDWMNNAATVVLQRLTLIHGAAPHGTYYPQDPSAPRCAYGYKEGSGGAIYMRNGRLHVIDSAFYDNEAALEGPDVGGGAIYALGAPEVIISGTTFRGNRGANGGAIGLLFANPQIYNSVFENNTAEGVGTNYVEPGCPNFNHDQQGGAGGNAGAIAFDGLNDDDVVFTVCGSVFRDNRANEIGGALFRTPNVGRKQMLIDRCSFEDNQARLGGVSFIKDNHVVVQASTFVGNRGGVDIDGNDVQGGFGGLWINAGTLDLVNSTFADNTPGGLDVEGSGTVRNATFVGSRSSGNLTVDNSLFVNTACNGPLGGTANLQWPEGAGCAAGLTFADPRLGELGDHGGPTMTFVPGAADAVMAVGANCPSTDQRGQPRSAQGCVAGAVEP